MFVAYYSIKMNPWGTGKGDLHLEARVKMVETLGKSDPNLHKPQVGMSMDWKIVHNGSGWR